jgi:hypothetical protein
LGLFLAKIYNPCYADSILARAVYLLAKQKYWRKWTMAKFVGFSLLLIATAGIAAGAITVAPEIDPASGVSALALLSGALLVLRSRRKS